MEIKDLSSFYGEDLLEVANNWNSLYVGSFDYFVPLIKYGLSRKISYKLIYKDIKKFLTSQNIGFITYNTFVSHCKTKLDDEKNSNELIANLSLNNDDKNRGEEGGVSDDFAEKMASLAIKQAGKTKVLQQNKPK